MEKHFSLNKIFTEDVNYKDITRPSATFENVYDSIKQAEIITTNTLSYNESSFNDALYRIKEVEKDISKNFLTSIYAYDLERKLVDGLHESVITYDYTNLDNTSVPSLDRLQGILDESYTILSKYDKFGTADAAEDVISFLKEESDTVDTAYATIRNDVLGIPLDTTITPETFVEEAFKLFRNGSKLESYVISEDDHEHYKASDEFIKKAACDSVECYNEKLVKCIAKLQAVVDLLKKDSAKYYNSAATIDERKKHLLKKLCKYACKFLAHANMAYAMKADAGHEFLHPSHNPMIRGFIIRKEFPTVELPEHDEEHDHSELESAMLESALEDIKLTSEDFIGDEYDVDSAVVCGKLESYEDSYAGYCFTEAMNDFVYTEADDNNNQTQPTNDTNVADASKEGTEQGAKPAENNNNQPTTAQNKAGITASSKAKFTVLADNVKKFFARMMFRLSKAAGKYSAYARNYNAEQLLSNYKKGGTSPDLYPKFLGVPKDANIRYQTFANNLRSKSISNNGIFNKADQDQSKYTKQYFVSKIADVNIPNDADDDTIKKTLNDYFRAGNQETAFTGAEINTIKLMIDTNMSAAMDINKISTTINNMLDEATRWSNTSFNESYDAMNKDQEARDRMAEALKEFFGESYEAYSDKEEAIKEAEENVAAAGKSNNETVISAATNYFKALQLVQGVVMTIFHELRNWNFVILNKLQAGDFKKEENKPEENQNQLPANNANTQPQQQQQNQ